MGLSRLLLLVAACTAIAPIAATWFRPPTTIRELEKAFVVAIAVLALGTLAVHQLHGLEIFTLAHLAYLIVVVTLPMLLGGWWLTALLRNRRTRLVRIGALVGLALAAAGVWGTHIEPNWLETDVVVLQAPVQGQLTIAVLADLQTPNVGRHEWNAVNTILEADPDLVLIPGDLFQGPTETIAAAQDDFVELIAALTAAVPEVAIVSGDSDRASRLRSIADAAGARFIDDRIVDVVAAGQPIRLAGVSVRGGAERLDVIAALSEPSDALTVLLSHRPDVVFELPLASDVDLIVSGHTHGGQVSLPLLGPPVTLSNVPRRVAAGGLGIVDRFPVYVSTGVGLERYSAPQVRFGVRPSVGIVEIVPLS